MNLKERKEFPLYHSLQKSLHLSLSLSLETWNLKREICRKKATLNKFPLHSRSNAFLSLPNGEKNDLEQITFFSLSFSRDSSSSETMKKATSEQKFPRPFKFVFTRRRGKNDLEQISFRSLFLKSLFLFERGKERGKFQFPNQTISVWRSRYASVVQTLSLYLSLYLFAVRPNRRAPIFARFPVM